MKRLIHWAPSNTILVSIIGLGLVIITTIVLLLVFVVPFDNQSPGEREDVQLCKAVWQEIELMAERYELAGLPPLEALEAAILYAAESVSKTDADVEYSLEALDKCIDILDDAGYFDKRLRPRLP